MGIKCQIEDISQSLVSIKSKYWSLKERNIISEANILIDKWISQKILSKMALVCFFYRFKVFSYYIFKVWRVNKLKTFVFLEQNLFGP
jgi:hypothetical protein